MIELQRFTGMRPGEVVLMRNGDIDRTGSVWLYRPLHHKTEHHGHERVIAIGPRAQQVLTPWLQDDSDAPFFSPREAMKRKRAEMRAKRKTKVQPSQRNRRKKNPKRQPKEQYTTHSFCYAVRRACEKAGVPVWHPHQIRHTRATELRERYGLDAARVILGHRSPRITETYAKLDLTKAIEIAATDG
jgi:integrase